MPLKVFIDNGSGDVEYTKYVELTSIDIQDNVNVPAVFSFVLYPSDSSFVEPAKGAYVKIQSTKLNRFLATGIITSLPKGAFLGLSHRQPQTKFQQLSYVAQCTSDEYLLNMKLVPFVPAFVNRTMGDILAELANTLAPGFFDTTNVDAGDLVPYFEYDPQMKWSEIAKMFADAARYRYKVINKKIYFKPYGDQPLGVDYNESGVKGGFDPYSMDLSVLAVPPVNDVIVIGEAEPQKIRDDYFIGDGITASFPLRHKAFAAQSQLLLQEDWAGQSLGNQWEVVDPLSQFGMNGTLVVQGVSGTLGASYIRARNAIELGGHLNLQHGEFRFNDTNTGILGGIYGSTSLVAPQCFAGFDIRPSASVAVTASGASGLLIQPMVSGGLVGFQITTKINHHYFLKTTVHARRYGRYNRTYRSLVGTVYGNQNLPAKAEVAFYLYEINLANPSNPVQHKYSQTVDLPAFGVYAPVNSALLNLNLSFTQINEPPQGNLIVASLYGPSGTQLPVRTPGAEQPYPLGFGFGEQVATLADAADVTELQFYRDTVPAVGARLRMQSWESARSIARVRDPAAIASEAAITGDDGIRTAIISNMNPLPSSSEECEAASQALISDRKTPIYDGSYVVASDLWNSAYDYPIPGRFLTVTTAARGVSGGQFFVRSVRIQVLEGRDEDLLFRIEFGQDTFFEKLLRAFTPRPAGVLTPTEAAREPDIQNISDVGATFLDNLVNVQITQITGTSVTVNLGALPATGCEVRRTDSGWGKNDQNRVGVFTTQAFTLQRGSIDQVWYLRQVNGPKSSRFSRVLRVVYPLVPSAPSAVVDVTDPLKPALTVSINGDVRNVAGIEIRDSDNVTVLPGMPRRYFSSSDLRYEFDNSTLKQRRFNWYLYTFNLQWEYSPVVALEFYIHPSVVDVEVDEATPALVGRTLLGTTDMAQYQGYPTASLVTPSITGNQATNVDAAGARKNSLVLPVEHAVQERYFAALGVDKLGANDFFGQLLFNQGIEAGFVYWSGSGYFMVESAALAHSGTRCLEINIAGSSVSSCFQVQLSGASRYIEVNPGDVIIFGGYAKRVSFSGAPFARFALRMLDASLGSPTDVFTPDVTSSSWTLSSATQVIPTGKKYVQFYAGTSGGVFDDIQARFDDMFLRRYVGHIYVPQGVVGFSNVENILTVPAPPTPGTAPTIPARFAGIAQDLIDESLLIYIREVLRRES